MSKSTRSHYFALRELGLTALIAWRIVYPSALSDRMAEAADAYLDGEAQP